MWGCGRGCEWEFLRCEGLGREVYSEAWMIWNGQGQCWQRYKRRMGLHHSLPHIHENFQNDEMNRRGISNLECQWNH